MSRSLSVVNAVLVLLFVLVATTTESDALKRRPTIGGIDQCEDDSAIDGSADHDCEGGIICSCCYSDGCFICTYITKPDQDRACVWEPAPLAGRKPTTNQVFEVLDPNVTPIPPARPPVRGPQGGTIRK